MLLLLDIFILLKQKYYRIYLFSPLFREHLCAFDLYLILFNIYPIHTSLYIYNILSYTVWIFICALLFPFPCSCSQFGLAPGRGNSSNNNNNKSSRSPSALAQCRQLPCGQLPLINARSPV